jgi:fumarylacetoacetate (FAA) hydrolase
LQPAELAAGFGFLQCKPVTSVAPWALTPDELGPLWKDGRFLGRVQVWRGAQLVGRPSAAGMDRSFGELIAHAARTRRLRAGTLLGSGTVSDAAEGVGSATLVEVRAIEQCTAGAVRTPYLAAGERIRIEALADDGRPLFGALDQQVVLAPSLPS